MRAIILAGGSGSRLHPLTKVTNKSLLPVYDKPMIYWPIQTMIDSGITEILVVCGGNASGEFLRILGNGEDFGLHRLNYAYQSAPRGIADALKLGEEWSENDAIAVVLSDNIFEDDFLQSTKDFEQSSCECKIFLKTVARPEWYGVVELGESIDENNFKVKSIEEKPKRPKSNLIATGLYMYKPVVWELIQGLSPSQRGELEITDLNKMFLDRGTLQAEIIEGYWGDAGESLDVYTDTCTTWAEICRKKKYL